MAQTRQKAAQGVFHSGSDEWALSAVWNKIPLCGLQLVSVFFSFRICVVLRWLVRTLVFTCSHAVSEREGQLSAFSSWNPVSKLTLWKTSSSYSLGQTSSSATFYGLISRDVIMTLKPHYHSPNYHIRILKMATSASPRSEILEYVNMPPTSV